MWNARDAVGMSVQAAEINDMQISKKFVAIQKMQGLKYISIFQVLSFKKISCI